QGDLEEAITHFEEVLRRQPDLVEAHYGLGIALIVQNRVGEGAAQLREALRLKPQFAKAHYHLGHALLREGDLEEAIGDFQTTRRLNSADAGPPAQPPETPILQETGSLGWGATARKLEDAIANCREKLNLDPERAETYLQLAVLQRESGKLEEAVEAFRQSVR